MNPVVIIPALNPDERLISLVGQLSKSGLPVVVVDDGSDQAHQVIFEILKSHQNCEILRHPANLGKGAALKSGLRHALEHCPGAPGFVTADADGQHSVEDIQKVASALPRHPDALILGTRDFSGADVPFNSRWGNRITTFVYALSTGRRCADTQTGLRGIPAALAPACLEVKGDRYEYEMNQLLWMGKSDVPLVPVPIRTIYLDENRSSHFHPLRDSAKIYFNILRFSLSSLLSATVDLGLFAVLASLVFGRSVEGLLLATVFARFLSGSLNFMINKHFVFQSGGAHSREARGYLVLFLGQMACSWILVSLLSMLPLPLILVKVLVDGTLFLISYRIQKKYIFQGKGARKPDEALSF